MIFRVNGAGRVLQGSQLDPARRPSAQREYRAKLEHLLDSAPPRQHEHAARLGRRAVRDRRLLLPVRREGHPALARHDVLLRAVPSTPGFLANVEREIRHQVKRLRDHPCIALWCGNNEDVGALTWFPESRKNRDRYIVDYDRLNEGVIGRVVDECDPTRTFWPSSPSAGRGRLLRQLARRRARATCTTGASGTRASPSARTTR